MTFDTNDTQRRSEETTATPSRMVNPTPCACSNGYHFPGAIVQKRRQFRGTRHSEHRASTMVQRHCFEHDEGDSPCAPEKVADYEPRTDETTKSPKICGHKRGAPFLASVVRSRYIRGRETDVCVIRRRALSTKAVREKALTASSALNVKVVFQSSVVLMTKTSLVAK